MKVDNNSNLNKDDKIPFSMEDTAKHICRLNYGCRRMMTALLKERERDQLEKGECSNHSIEWTQKLRELLEAGYY